ncbi:MAG: hypothetical protein WCW13_03360 [archaeon]|jgi:hypothetical protein
MPNRKGVVFTGKEVAGARILKKLNVGPTRNVGTGFYYGKIYLRRGAFPRGKGFAQRAFFKMLPNKAKGEEEMAVRRKIEAAGVKIPKAGVVEIDGKFYLAVQPFLGQRNEVTKIIPINWGVNAESTPTFLTQLSTKKDGALIRNLATDTARIFNAGIFPTYFDFFGFYPKGNSYERVITDTEFLHENDNLVQLRSQALRIETLVHRVFLSAQKSEEATLFCKVFEENLKKSLKTKNATFWTQGILS